MNFLMQIETVNSIGYILKTFFISIYTYYIALKIINRAENHINPKQLKVLIEIIIISIFYMVIKDISNFFYSTVFLTLLLARILYKETKNNIGYSIIITVIALSINYVIFLFSVIISFIPSYFLKIENNIIGLGILLVIYSILILGFARIKRLKNGMDFLRKDSKNQTFDILVFNISVIILFLVILFQNYDKLKTDMIGYGIIIFSIIMFITIQKSLQLYYKQKLLVQELNETKEELEIAKRELKQLEEENLSFSKNSHTLAHKQKSLEYKIQQLVAKTEISTEEAGEVEDRIKEIQKDLYKDKAIVELSKTEIPEIDDMLKYMQSECIKNKIEFVLQLAGNIHYMTNNLISKEDLEILLADHIKDAIIAINHSDNINRSILVRLGEIEEIYSLYIYDSGIEFEKETLENLGEKPSTTHANEGGTGMGFMNTFDTLRKYEASLIINELSKPNKDNYTKVLIFKFDKNNEFKIISYRQEAMS